MRSEELSEKTKVCKKCKKRKLIKEFIQKYILRFTDQVNSTVKAKITF